MRKMKAREGELGRSGEFVVRMRLDLHSVGSCLLMAEEEGNCREDCFHEFGRVEKVEDIWVDDASISKEACVSAYDIESVGTRVGTGECCVVDVGWMWINEYIDEFSLNFEHFSI